MDNDDPHMASLQQQFASFFKNSTSLVTDIIDLASLEASLAQQSIFMLIVLAAVAIILALAIWGCILAAFFAGLLAWKLSIWLAFLIVGFFNVLLLGVVIYLIYSYKKNLGFPATKKHLNWKLHNGN